ncbi:MAG: YbbR-like domain-containing protein [Candidatus Eisenbacteria bacterium]|nr:YbbR-like domain-containing protein [Candidatus Eisenbacteria bacterium]
MIRVTRNLGIKVVAFLITGVLCLNAETERMVEVETDVPVTYINLPDSLVRMGPAPEKVRVRTIFNRRFWQSRPDYLVAEIDLSRARRGTQRFAVTPNAVRIPPDRKARVVDVLDPFRIPLTFDRKVRARVPVAPTLEKEPAAGFVVYGTPVTEPDRVMLIGPESVLEGIDRVETLPVDLSGAEADIRFLSVVDVSPWEQVQSDPAQVEVLVDLERIEDRILLKRPVRTAPRYRVSLEPDSLDLVVRGPTAALERIRESVVRLYIDLSKVSDGAHVYLSEIAEGNGIRFYPRQVRSGMGEGDTLAVPPEEGDPAGSGSPELLGEVQNLPDLVVLVDFSPKIFTVRRGGS